MEREEYARLARLEDRFWWFVGMRAISVALLERFLPARRPLHILDAGCGTGGMLRALAAYGNAVGVDVSMVALEFAHRNSARLIQGSVSALPFPKETFDLVTSFDVIYHQAVPDDVLALREMARVLSAEGTLLVRVPAHDRLRSSHDRAVHTRQRYEKRELLGKLRAAGLDPVYISYANSFLYPLAWLKRTAEGWRGSENHQSDVRELPEAVNRIFTAVLRLEARIMRQRALPFGLSLVALARKSQRAAGPV